MTNERTTVYIPGGNYAIFYGYPTLKEAETEVRGMRRSGSEAFLIHYDDVAGHRRLHVSDGFVNIGSATEYSPEFCAAHPGYKGGWCASIRNSGVIPEDMFATEREAIRWITVNRAIGR